MRRLALQWRAAGVQVGFVPTMGCLHEGHLSLIRRARRCVGREGLVVVSIYVNPAQFGPGEDFRQYPRDLARDRRLCREAGVDVLLVPTDRQMYPPGSGGPFSTFVVEEKLARTLEGISRPTHFRGVTTVVAKLLHLVLPEVAVFGAKDYQQAAVVCRMVRDLDFPVRIVVAPTVREADGLALSSRNRYLSAEERTQAVALSQAIQAARARVRASRRGIAASQLLAELRWLIETRPAARVDYLELVDPATLESVPRARPGVHLVLAVFVGKTRLIDNGRL